MKNKSILSCMIVAAMIFTGCTTSNTEEAGATVVGLTNQAEAQGELISIVATSFHEYDWVMQIIGEDNDNFDVTLLMDTGVDMHSYEPSVEDIATISSADLFIYNGGASQVWIDDLVSGTLNDNLTVVNVMESLGNIVQAEVQVEGMQASEHAHDHAEDEHDHAEDEHDHSEDEHDHAEDEHDHAEDEHDHAEDEHDHAEDEHSEAGHDDEHVWLSLNNAIIACEHIGAQIAKLDAEGAESYAENTSNYTQMLSDLDKAYVTAIADADRDTLIFADRFPFLYMMSDYDVNYYAAFQGCSAETEATFETVTFLAEKVNELDAKKLLIIDNGLIELAETINENSEDKDSETLVLHSMQSVSQEEISSGASYYDYMLENLETLKTALAD